MEWPCPLPGGGISNELALVADTGGPHRLLIIPALFDEANRMRRFTVEVMRRLAGAGIACFLPDLPGCNESTARLDHQTPADWQLAMAGAARHFAASHVLAIRGGALMLAGYPLSADFIDEFNNCIIDTTSPQTTIGQDMIGGGGLWLRAEPGENSAQADALAAIVAMALAQAKDAA